MKKVACAPMPVQLSTEPDRKSATAITLDKMKEEWTAPLVARIKVLEGHRHQWRERAFQLMNLVRDESFASALVLVQEWDEEASASVQTGGDK